jgi:hypothetical protein
MRRGGGAGGGGVSGTTTGRLTHCGAAAQSNATRRRRKRADPTQHEGGWRMHVAQIQHDKREVDGACGLTQHDEDDEYPAEQSRTALLRVFHLF